MATQQCHSLRLDHDPPRDCSLQIVTKLSLTAILVQWSSLEEVDDAVDGRLSAVHLPVATHEELATHLGGGELEEARNAL